jgi:predicted regulator of Ras-like GTPase activity (Roadblock/LC7/MglB family)
VALRHVEHAIIITDDGIIVATHQKIIGVALRHVEHAIIITDDGITVATHQKINQAIASADD